MGQRISHFSAAAQRARRRPQTARYRAQVLPRRPLPSELGPVVSLQAKAARPVPKLRAPGASVQAQSPRGRGEALCSRLRGAGYGAMLAVFFPLGLGMHGLTHACCAESLRGVGEGLLENVSAVGLLLLLPLTLPLGCILGATVGGPAATPEEITALVAAVVADYEGYGMYKT